MYYKVSSKHTGVIPSSHTVRIDHTGQLFETKLWIDKLRYKTHTIPQCLHESTALKQFR
jgi:hypothetical protein